MQKNFILLGILIISICNASELGKIEPQDASYMQKSPAPSLDIPSNIAEYNQDNEEYDQHITDAVTAPQVSSVEVVFRNIVGSLLIQYILLREKTHYYLEKMKGNCMCLYRKALQYFH